MTRNHTDTDIITVSVKARLPNATAAPKHLSKASHWFISRLLLSKNCRTCCILASSIYHNNYGISVALDIP